MILLALDVDGTLSTSGGPFPWSVVEALHYLTPPGVVRIVVVSGSEHWPGTARTGIPLFNLPDRADGLRAAAAAYPWCTRRLYAGDQESDRAAAAAAGWDYVPPAEWSKIVELVADATAKAAQR